MKGMLLVKPSAVGIARMHSQLQYVNSHDAKNAVCVPNKVV